MASLSSGSLSWEKCQKIFIEAVDLIRSIFYAFENFHSDSEPESTFIAKNVVTIISAPDPDSLCAVYLLQTGLGSRLGLKIQLIVANSYAQLSQLLDNDRTEKYSCFTDSPCVVFVNIGGRCDIRPYLKISDDQKIFIIDSYRPLAPTYISAPSQEMIVVLPEELRHLEKHMQKIEKKNRIHDDADLLIDEDILEDEDLLIEDLYDFVPTTGEYFTAPVTLIVFEALKAEFFDDPTLFFITSVGLAYPYLLGIMSRHDYCRRMSVFIKDLEIAQKRFGQRDRRFNLFKSIENELLLPLFRFTSVHDSLENSVLFRRTQTIRMEFVDGFAKELANVRVRIGMKEKLWNEQFRLLRPKEQREIERETLAKTLHQMTTYARKRLQRRHPDASEYSGCITGPVLYRELRIIGLPSKITSLDVCHMLMGMTTYFPKSYNIHFETEAQFLTNEVSPLKLISSLSEIVYYSFLQGIQFMQGLMHTGFNQLSDSMVFEVLSDETLVKTNSRSYPWNTYSPITTESAHALGMDVCIMRSIATLSQINLYFQREAFTLINRLLSNRKANNRNVYRRSSWNLEGYLTHDVPYIIYHPFWLKYIAATMADIISRGILSASPSIIILSSCKNPIDASALIISYKSNPALFDPSLIAQNIHEHLQILEDKGHIEFYSSYGFDASTIYIPRAQLNRFFDSLFPAKLETYREQPSQYDLDDENLSSPPSQKNHSSENENQFDSNTDIASPVVADTNDSTDSASSPDTLLISDDISEQKRRRLTRVNPVNSP